MNPTSGPHGREAKLVNPFPGGAVLDDSADGPVRPRILGLDPGLQVTGYAALEAGPRGPRVCEAGVVRSSERREPADMAHRVRILYDSIEEIVRQFRPGVVAVEQLYAHYEHPRTAILMGHAR